MIIGNIRIAIDGPAGAGKSTVAKKLAEALRYVYLDTGAMYRALTLAALRNQLDVSSESNLNDLLQTVSISLTPEGQVFLDEEDVSSSIRMDKVSEAVSAVARHGRVRKEMVNRQQQFARHGGIVMDGRDIGTQVLPQAELKIFLTASAEIRGYRRYLENKNKGISADLAQITADIRQRDEQDTNRDVSPLIKADDAFVIDSSELSVAEVVEQLVHLAEERKG